MNLGLLLLEQGLLQHQLEHLNLPASPGEAQPYSVLKFGPHQLGVLKGLLQELDIRDPEVAVLIQSDEGPLIEQFGPLNVAPFELKLDIRAPKVFLLVPRKLPQLIQIGLKGKSLVHLGLGLLTDLPDF